MLEMARSSPSCGVVRAAALGAEGSWGLDDWPKEGSRSHEDQDEDVDCCVGSGIVVLGVWLVLFCAADACELRACCNHISRVLWSTGHFSSSPPCVAFTPKSFMFAAAAVVPSSGLATTVPLPALSPWFVPSLRLTRTVSSSSVCIMRASYVRVIFCETVGVCADPA